MINHLSFLDPQGTNRISLRRAPTHPRGRRPPAAGGRHVTSPCRRIIRVLLVTGGGVDAEPAQQELTRAPFIVSWLVADGVPEVIAHLSQHPTDAVVYDDRLGDERAVHLLELVRHHDPEMPVIIVTGPTDLTGGADEDVVAELMLTGATDCVDQQRLNLLPLAVALAVEERTQRAEHDRVEHALQQSQALYRALSDNPTYGICQVDADGRLRDVNPALVTMLGYASRDELVAIPGVTYLMRHPAERAQLLESCRRTGRVDALECEWRCKDGTPIKVQLSGQPVPTETARPDGWELIVEDVTAQRALVDHLQQLATTDPLTGLANYRQLTTALDAEIRRAERTGRSFAVLLCDLDAMKHVNDQYGHVAGNRALCRLADALRLSCRSIDTAARYGGDEFAIVLPEAGASEARVVERRICEHLARDPERPSLSLSVGTAVYPQDGTTIDHLIRTADRDLYQMKPRGPVGTGRH